MWSQSLLKTKMKVTFITDTTMADCLKASGHHRSKLANAFTALLLLLGRLSTAEEISTVYFQDEDDDE